MRHCTGFLLPPAGMEAGLPRLDVIVSLKSVHVHAGKLLNGFYVEFYTPKLLGVVVQSQHFTAVCTLSCIS